MQLTEKNASLSGEVWSSPVRLWSLSLSVCLSVCLCLSFSLPPHPPPLSGVSLSMRTRAWGTYWIAQQQISLMEEDFEEWTAHSTRFDNIQETPPPTHTHTRPNEAPHHAHVTVWQCTTANQTVLRLLTSVARVHSGGKISIFSNPEEANNCSPPSVNNDNSLALAMFDEPWWIQVSHSDHLAFSVNSTLVTLKTNKHCFC